MVSESSPLLLFVRILQKVNPIICQKTVVFWHACKVGSIRLRSKNGYVDFGEIGDCLSIVDSLPGRQN